MKRGILSFIWLLAFIFIFFGCSSSEDHFKDGNRNFHKGDYDQAAKDYSMAIQINPNRTEYYINYGMTLIALGNYKEAITQLEEAYQEKDMKRINENNKKIYRAKGIAYYQMKQYRQSVEQLDLALVQKVLTGLDKDILYYKADALMKLGSYDDAIAIFTSMLSKNGKDEVALAQRAYAFYRQGEYTKSAEDFDKVISIQPDNYEYYIGKYYLLRDQGLDSEASLVLSQAAAIEAKSDLDRFSWAKIHYLQGEYDKALDEMNDCYTKGFSEAYYYIGEINREKKDYPAANFYYEKYMEKGKDLNPAVYNQYGACLMKLGEYEKAVKSFELGIKCQDVTMNRILLKNNLVGYEYLGDYKKAKELLEQYVNAYPEDMDARREIEFVNTR